MPTGIASIQNSKANGSWDFLNDVDQLLKPEEFLACLNAYPNALANFNTFGASHQRFILRWIKLTKQQKPGKNEFKKQLPWPMKIRRYRGCERFFFRIY
jgi:uncharacterized protein YdeI (YjbR/CyaY-like superfamily)